MDGFHSATLIENLFDKNCYNNSIPGYTRANSTFNHGLYVNGNFNNDAANYYTNGPVTMSGNIYTRDATTPHLRSGGFLNNNLWASNTAIYDFGRPNASLTYSITNDVYLENIDQPGVSIYTSMDGWGHSFFSTVQRLYNEFCRLVQ